MERQTPDGGLLIDHQSHHSTQDGSFHPSTQPHLAVLELDTSNAGHGTIKANQPQKGQIWDWQ
jgi:hypothetical protein